MATCPHCSARDHQRKCGVNRAGLQRYKCLECSRKYIPGIPPRRRRDYKSYVQIKCLHCGKLTQNPKFCSRSCNAIYNNTLKPKRAKTKTCAKCGALIPSVRKNCTNCVPNRKDWSTRTIADIHSAAKYQVSSQLRTMARQQFAKSQRQRICQNCGYSKHVEICHIHAIQDFPPDTPVSIVSGIDNLVALCPNCHWEFDHGVLHIEDIPPAHL